MTTDAGAALRVLAEASSHVPVVLLSGLVDGTVAADALAIERVENLGDVVAVIERSLLEGESRRKVLEVIRRLRGSARMLARFQESVIGADRDGRIIFWSEGAAKLQGSTAREMDGQPLAALFVEGVGRNVQAALEAARKTGNAEGEALVRRKDIDPVWVEIRIISLEDDAGRDEGFLVVLRDISERKAREKVFQLHDRALAKISQGVVITDSARRIVYTNDAFTKITGYAPSEMLTRNCSILQGAGTDPAAVMRIREALNGNRPFEGVILNYRKDGSTFWNELSISPLEEPDGSVRFIGILRDITSRMRAEEALKRSLERVRVAASATGVGIWELDIPTGETMWDEEMFALFGRPAGNAIGGLDRWFSAMSPEDIERCRGILREVIDAGQELFQLEFTIRRDDDASLRLIQSQGIVQRNVGGEAVRLIGSIRDITADRAREEGLARALVQEKALLQKAQAGERAKGEFLAVMSHEIRTPMNGILGFAELLCQSPELSEVSRDYARTIASSGEALLRILDDVLDFSRLETGRLQIEKKAFSPREMLEDIRMLLSRRAAESGLTLAITADPSAPGHLLGDVGRLRQVLINLVGNAIKFTPAGRVEVEFRQMDDGLFEFIVRDTGPGIPQDKQEEIFQPFVQADKGISRRYGGTGLGLAISRRLVTLLGGTLDVHSELGKGATFTLKIPLEVLGNTLAPTPAPERLDADFAVNHPLKVLLVEDDKVNLKLLSALMHRLGYTPLTAVNGRQAVDIVRRTRPDCVLMDLQMPEMDGIEATEAIRAMERRQRAGVPTFISALTANIFPVDRQRCEDAGMDDYLNKPVKLAQLASTLERAFRSRCASGPQPETNGAA